MKNVLLDQPAGIGDILFLQKLQQIICEKNNVKVWHPVKKSLEWMVNYLPTLCKKSDCDGIHFDLVIKTDGCSNGTPFKIMEAKYKLLNMEFNNYVDYININRKLDKEEELFQSLVGDCRDYRLVNSMYGTPDELGNTLFLNPKKSSKIKNIEMSIISGYTLFDWLKIIENATEIHTTDTAIMFLIEKYNCMAKELVCYSRRPHTNEIDYLFKKSWRYNV